MTEAHDSDDTRFADALGFVLGADPDGDEAFRDALADDPSLLLETAELKELVEDFRSLEVEPSGHVPLRVWPQVRQHAVRRGLRARHIVRPRDRALDVAVVVTIAASLLVGLVLLKPDRKTSSVLPESPTLGGRSDQARVDSVALRGPSADFDRLPISDQSFADAYHSIADRPVMQDGVSPSLALAVSAENLLSRLRRDARLRFEAGERRRQERALAVPDLDRPVERLADEVSQRLVERLAIGPAAGDDEEAIVRASMVRSLLAAGSTLRHGPHREVLQAAALDLVEAADSAETKALGPLGIALCDLAALEGAPFDRAVHRVAGRLVDDALGLRTAAADETAPTSRRGALLAWSTPAAHLAEAGRVLQVAPAFGAAAGPCFRARLLTLAHLVERDQQPGRVDPPSVLTAQLYGFGDLVDRYDLDTRMRLWSIRTLFADVETAVQLAWSRYPIRRGWADLQQELLQFSTLRTPKGDLDAASLLLILTTNVAAPGVSEALAEAEAPRRATGL